MKLPIKKVYFDAIKAGKKKVEYRDAHITFVCEETGETLRREVVYAEVIETPKGLEGVCDDKCVIAFDIEKTEDG